ncbi:MAG: MATE family multidrug resistance protein [Sphingobacteriales bacterium]|jgi:MATE family multidrug resistance protein
MDKKILGLAIPNIISNLSVPLLGMIDTALMGHLGNEDQIGAIALGGVIFSFIYWGFGFLRMGTTGLTAQALGSKNQSETIAILIRGLIVALSMATLVFALQVPIGKLSFFIINGSPEVEKYASQYFFIRIYAAPATLCLYAFHGWFLGMQNSKIPMFLTIFGSLANIGFNLFFIFGWGMLSDGVAWGTVLAQYSTLLVALWFFRKKFVGYLSHISMHAIKNVEQLTRFFKVNSDIFIRTLCLVFTLSFFTAKSAEFGDLTLAGNSILLILFNMIAYGVDGFAFAAESLVGKAYGEKDKKQLQTVIKRTFLMSLGLAIFFSLVFLIAGKNVLYLFTDKEDIIKAALPFLPWIIIAPLINAFPFIWDGVFIGLTRTKPMRNTMVLSTFLLFLPIYYFTQPILGNHSLWLAMTIFMLGRGLGLTFYYRFRRSE